MTDVVQVQLVHSATGAGPRPIAPDWTNATKVPHPVWPLQLLPLGSVGGACFALYQAENGPEAILAWNPAAGGLPYTEGCRVDVLFSNGQMNSYTVPPLHHGCARVIRLTVVTWRYMQASAQVERLGRLLQLDSAWPLGPGGPAMETLLATWRDKNTRLVNYPKYSAQAAERWVPGAFPLAALVMAHEESAPIEWALGFVDEELDWRPMPVLVSEQGLALPGAAAVVPALVDKSRVAVSWNGDKFLKGDGSPVPIEPPDQQHFQLTREACIWLLTGDAGAWFALMRAQAWLRSQASIKKPDFVKWGNQRHWSRSLRGLIEARMTLGIDPTMQFDSDIQLLVNGLYDSCSDWNGTPWITLNQGVVDSDPLLGNPQAKDHGYCRVTTYMTLENGGAALLPQEALPKPWSGLAKWAAWCGWHAHLLGKPLGRVFVSDYDPSPLVPPYVHPGADQTGTDLFAWPALLSMARVPVLTTACNVILDEAIAKSPVMDVWRGNLEEERYLSVALLVEAARPGSLRWNPPA